jgi:Na+/H+ antiporter NhaC
MTKRILLITFLILAVLPNAHSADIKQYSPELPSIILSDTDIKIYLKDNENSHGNEATFEGQTFYVNDKEAPVLRDKEGYYLSYAVNADDEEIVIRSAGWEWKEEIDPIPLWMSIIPPLIAIFLALILREVITSLFVGIFSGALIIGLYSDGFSSILLSFFSVIDTYILNALYDRSHISVIIFSMTIAGVVSVISRNGGMKGIVNRISPYAHNAKSGQLVIWFMGILIFFDDYANTLVVGNTMRPVSDRLRISREKLAYIVDSTAAPVAAIFFITTWIGAELGYIESGIAEIPAISESPYSIFLNSLSYSFYPILTLIFILMLILKQRDFGSMFNAEQKARVSTLKTSDEAFEDTFDEFDEKEGVVPKAFNALIPILVIVVGAVLGMLFTGYSESVWQNEGLGFFRKLSITIGNADSFIALLWSSVAGLFAAIILTLMQGMMKLGEAIETAIEGYKTMLPAMFILILAWSLAYVTEDMHTATFLKGLWSSTMSPVFIPAIVFILSALVSFSTGSSWGTMAILYPLMLPASYQIAVESGMGHEESMIIFYNVVSVILAGSVFGDHCSPISDTTILSSLASSCNHIDHVRTQLPYALTVGVVSILIGSIPAAMGISTLILFPVAIAVLYTIIHFLGKETGDQ